MNIRKILCPTDFSEYTDAALNYASVLATESDATMYIVHVDEYRDATASMGEAALSYPAPWAVADRAEVRQQLDKVIPTRPGVDFEHRYLSGGPIREIVDFAEREHVDLIVMGSHGRTGISRLLMGSVAEGVARRAPCPVMIVKQPHQAAESTTNDDAMVLQD